MVRAGLGPDWRCLFANDFDPAKAASYRENWGGAEFREGDIAKLSAADLPGQADLIWGSSPCQDLSLAGAGAGLSGARSGTYHAFWRLIDGLIQDGRAPAIVAVENVTGALTSHGGADFAAMMGAFAEHGYRAGAMVIDAVQFLPQSRPRLFIIGARDQLAPDEVTDGAPSPAFHPEMLMRAIAALPASLRDQHLLWRLPEPARRNTGFSALTEAEPAGVKWHSEAETARLLSLMSPAHLAKVEAAKRARAPVAATIYRRTRPDGKGGRVQRAEIRLDDVAGCLRTPSGGSSRQIVMIIDGETIRSRLLSPRESARLMGLGDDYRLPEKLNAALHLTGDGVAVPVVRHLAAHIFTPLLAQAARIHAA